MSDCHKQSARFEYTSNLKSSTDTRAIPVRWCWNFRIRNALQLSLHCTSVTKTCRPVVKLLRCWVGLLGCQQTTDGRQEQCQYVET